MRQGCAVGLALACGCASAASTRPFARPTLAEQVGFREIEIVPASFLPARDVAILNNVAAETVQREFADAIAAAGRRLTGLRFSVSTRLRVLSAECEPPRSKRCGTSFARIPRYNRAAHTHSTVPTSNG